MGRPVLLFHHTHTPDSNRFEREVRDLRIDSHVVDYVELTRRLPRGVDAIYIKTDHWKTNPAYFSALEARLAGAGVAVRRADTHVYFELSGTRAAIINGVEASVQRQGFHITIAGLPLTDSKTYHSLSFERLRSVASAAGWIAPAHIGMPFHRIPDRLLRNVCSLSEDSDIAVALGYTTGYFPAYNRLSRNEIPTRTSVSEYAREFDVPLLPELDLHGVVPTGFSGCGVVRDVAMKRLRERQLPVERILGADLLRPASGTTGVSVGQCLQNYAALLPVRGWCPEYETRFQRSIPNVSTSEELDIGTRRASLP